MPDKTQPQAPAPFRCDRLDGVYCGVLKIRAANADLVARAGVAIGTALPATPNTVLGTTPRALWLAPGEWLIVQNRAFDGAEGRFAAALDGVTWHFADVTHGRTVFALSGRGVRAFLNRGTSLDLHPRIFAQGTCAQTLFANIPALLHLIDSEEPAFHLFVDASFEPYLAAWIARVNAVFDPEDQS